MLFRARIAFVAAFVVLAGTVLTATLAGNTLKQDAHALVEARVGEAQETFSALERMRGIEVTNDAARFAREDESAQIFDQTGDPQRKAAFAAVEVFNARLGRDEHRADIVAVVNAQGHVVARDLNIGAMFDEDLKAKYPAVGKALAGTAVKDLWLFDGHMYRVAVAPIRSKAGQVVGALLVGYVTSAKDAAADQKKLGTQVAYFLEGKIHASSFSKDGQESAEEKDIATAVFVAGGPADSAASGDFSKNFNVNIGGVPYIAAAGPMPGNMTRGKSGFIVLAPTQDASVSKIVSLFYALGTLSLLCLIGAAVGTALRFVRPLDNMETGVAEVINGNHDFTFETSSPDFEGLANGLNVMVARLTGRPDPSDEDMVPSDDDGRNSGPVAKISPGGDPPVDNMAATGPQLSPENAKIAAEPEAEYFKRTFEEYLTARKQHGESIEGLTLDGFSAKLRSNEEQLKIKFGTTRVRFKVVIKDGATTLKPIPIP